MPELKISASIPESGPYIGKMPVGGIGCQRPCVYACVTINRLLQTKDLPSQ